MQAKRWQVRVRVKKMKKIEQGLCHTEATSPASGEPTVVTNTSFLQH